MSSLKPIAASALDAIDLQLLSALQTDASIDRPGIKNPPVQSIVERQIQLSACRFVDEIVVYTTEQDLIDLILTLPIDVRILGQEYEEFKAKADGQAQRLERKTGLKFKIKGKSFSKGQIQIRFNSEEEFYAAVKYFLP